MIITFTMICKVTIFLIFCRQIYDVMFYIQEFKKYRRFVNILIINYVIMILQDNAYIYIYNPLYIRTY